MNGQSMIMAGDVMADRLGSVDPASFQDEEFDLYSIPAFDSGRSELVLGKNIGSAKQMVQPGDVLLSKIVPHIRRSWVVGASRGRRIIASGEWIVFRSERVHPPYLRHVLVGDPFHAHFMATVSGVGGSLLRARPSYVAMIEIPLPSLDEQRRIADILDRADALRAKRRAAITHLSELTEAVFVEMFGNPALNPKRWPTMDFGDLLIEGPQNGLYKPSADYGSGTPILRIDAFYNGKINDVSTLKRVQLSDSEQRNYGLHEGDIIVNRVNSMEYLGKCALIPRLHEKVVFESNMMRMKVDKNVAAPRFVVQLLQTDFIKSQIANSAKRAVNQASINQKDVCGFTVVVPPISIQQRFVDQVGQIEKTVEVNFSYLKYGTELFSSLQDRAFRGAL